MSKYKLLIMVALLLVVAQTLRAETIDKIKFIKVSEQEGKAVIKDADNKLCMVSVGDVIGMDGKVINPEKKAKNKKDKTSDDILRVVEITKDRVLLERQTQNGPEKIVVRLVNGKQSIEKITVTKPMQPGLVGNQVRQVTGK